MNPTSARISWKSFFLPFIFLSLIHFSSRAQTVFWSDNFDAPAGGTNNNNAGAGWTVGGPIDYDDEGESAYGFPIGIINLWKTGNTSGCSSGNKLFVGNNFANTNSYVSDNISDIYALSPNISTVGVTGMTLKFSWRCNGETTDFGEVGYSKDGGTTWTWLPKHYVNQSACTTETLTIPATYEGLSNFKIGFGFHSHATSCSTCDPPFNIDNIEITCNTCPGASCSAPIASAGNAASVCTGGSTTIGGSPTASGGSGGAYTYSWQPATGLNNPSIANPSASPLVNTTYTVTVSTGSGCSATSSVVVTVGGTAQAGTVTAGRDTVCSGTVASLNVTGNSNPIQWQSSTDGSNFTDISGSTDANCLQVINQTTWYRVVAGSGNCTATTNPYKITSAESPVASFYVKSHTGNQITFSSDSSIGATAYNWNFGDTPNPGEVQSTSANPVHTYDSVKTYHVCLTVLNGSNCSFTICKDISTAVGIRTVTSDSEWKVYPVPFSDNLIIMREKYSAPAYEIEIYDLPGRMVFSRNYLNTGNDSYIIDLMGLPSGMYYVKIKTGDSNIIMPIIKQ